jgi:hypothetical protein
MVPSLEQFMLYNVTHNSISSKLYIHHSNAISLINTSARCSEYWEGFLRGKWLLGRAQVKDTSPSFVPRQVYSRIKSPHGSRYRGWLEGRGAIPGSGKRYFSTTPESRQALGPTQPPIQGVPGPLSSGDKAVGA